MKTPDSRDPTLHWELFIRQRGSATQGVPPGTPGKWPCGGTNRNRQLGYGLRCEQSRDCLRALGAQGFVVLLKGTTLLMPSVLLPSCSSVDLRKYTPAVADQLLHLSAHLLDASIQASNELLASSRVRLRIVLRAPKDDVEENGNEVQALLS